MSVPAICEGMVAPTNATGASNVQSAVVEGRTLELRQGYLDGVQYAWTRLSDAHDGDSIWLEITNDGGRTWTQCGRRTLQKGGRNYTDAQRTSSSSQVGMRAATQLAGPKYQTAAWL